MFKCEIKDFLLTAGEYSNVPCSLPASLYSVLYDNGYIENPYYQKNALNTLAGEINKCSFSSVFKLDCMAASSKYLYLFISGVMAKAEVIVNGKSFGYLENPNKRYCIDIGDVAFEGDNSLEIICLSPFPSSKPMNGNDYVEVPDIKDMGIIGSVEIKGSNRGIIKSVGVTQQHKDGKVTVGVMTDTIGGRDETTVITLVSPIGKLYFGSVIKGEGTVNVPDPALWWPRTMGTPNLYKLNVTLYHGGEAEDTAELEIGLCDIRCEIVDGKEALRVNGMKILSLGGEFHWGDLIMPYATYESCEELIKIAAESNFNTLKVGYSDMYPPEYFYSLCDKYGIIAWQDIYASYEQGSSAVPFSMLKTEEFSEVLCRILRHPSAVVSRLRAIVPSTGEEPSEGAVQEFVDSCKRIVRPVYALYAPNSEICFENEGVTIQDELTAGGGIDCFCLPQVESLYEFADDEDMNLFSSVMEFHTEGREHVGEVLKSISESFRFPSGLYELAYCSQLASARALQEAVTDIRLGGSAGVAECAVLRRFNDIWPAISPSRVDFYGKKKAAAYISARVFAPVMASAKICGAKAVIFVSSQSAKPYEGKITYSLYDRNGKCYSEVTKAVHLEPMSCAVVDEMDYSKYIGENFDEYYMLFELYNEKFVDCTGSRLFVPPKHFKFADPKIQANIIGSGKNFEVSLLAAAYATGVEIDFGEIPVKLSDNFIDLREGVAEKINVKTEDVISPEKLSRALKIRSVYDIGRKV